MSSSDALPIPRKNTAYRVYFPMLRNDGSILTGWTSPAATISKDGGTSASSTNTPTEIASSWGIGYLDLTSTEMNADAVIVKSTATNSGALAQVLVLYPQEAGDIRVNPTYWNDSAVATPDTAGYPIVTVKSGGVPTVVQIRQEIDANSTQLARIANKTDLITTDNFTVIAPLDPLTGDLTLVRGDDYTVSSGRPLPTWSSDDWTVYDLLHSGAVMFRARTRYGDMIYEAEGTVLNATTVRVALTSAETGNFSVGGSAYHFDLRAVLATGDVVTLAQGQLSVVEDVR